MLHRKTTEADMLWAGLMDTTPLMKCASSRTPPDVGACEWTGSCFSGVTPASYREAESKQRVGREPADMQTTRRAGFPAQ